MQSVISHAFEDHLVRSFEREDGQYCFIAKDVCGCLDVKNSRQSLESLDKDEKGVCLTYTLGGEQSVSYVTEGGLYTLILRSRKAVTPGTVQHRFRKWVTSEVLPALRSKGRYGADLPEGPEPELSVKLALVRETRLTFGRDAARAMWHEVGLPYIEPPAPEADDHPVNEFLAECTATAPGHQLPSAELRAAYSLWAEKRGKPQLSMTAIGRRIKWAGIGKTGRAGRYAYVGIDLIPTKQH